MSALDALIEWSEEWEKPLNGRSLAFNGFTLGQAKYELAALRQRVGDLEILLRESLDGRVQRRLDGRGQTYLLHTNRVHFTQASLASDPTGLPILTDEARKALQGNP